MKASRRTTHALAALFTLVLMSAAVMAQNIGAAYPANGPVSDQKAGSILVWNYYTSSTTSNNRNTHITVTNTNASEHARLHLFFVKDDCFIADGYMSLTPSQTTRVDVSKDDPDTNGYIIGVAVGGSGLPTSFNYLIGDEYIKFPSSSGQGIVYANLGAEAIAAEFRGDYPDLKPTSPVAVITFGGGFYNKLPSVLAASNIPSIADGNEIRLIVNSISGDASGGALTALPSRLPAILYDAAENPYSTFLTGGKCQINVVINDANIRVIGRLASALNPWGWLKFYTTNGNTPMLGAQIVFHPNAGTSRADTFIGGHNLHKLALTTGNTTLTLPIY